MTSPALHLSYCTNIHPGESWAEVRANLERYLVPVRERVAPGAPFGVGLRLSGESARALAAPEALEELRAFLRAHDLYVFTINGFPYGPFHGRPVKEQVYLPDWLDPERLAYTDRLADILAALVPEGVEGTISTVPGAFAPRVHGDADQARMARAMLDHVAHLVRHPARHGTRIALALEPEPCCFLETIDEAVAFFERHLFSREAVGDARGDDRARARATPSRRSASTSASASTRAISRSSSRSRRGCSPRSRAAGIRVPKVQVTAGLRVLIGDGAEATLDALGAFADDVYLHQVVERRAGRHAGAPSRPAAGAGRRAGVTRARASGACTSTSRCSASGTGCSRERRRTSPSCCAWCSRGDVSRALRGARRTRGTCCRRSSGGRGSWRDRGEVEWADDAS